MADPQFIFVSLIIMAAIVFAVIGVFRRSRTFTATTGCDSDCGCSGKSKNTVH